MTCPAGVEKGHLNSGWIYRDTISASDSGICLIDFYTRNYSHSDRSTWLERIARGEIWVNGKLARPETVLQTGTKCEYHRQPWIEPEVPQNYSIVYQDDDILLLDKPAGLPVLPGGNYLENTLLALIRSRFEDSVVPVHRLGRGTSGLILFACSPAARRNLSRDFREEKMGRWYRTKIAGISFPELLRINQRIGKVPHPLLGSIFAASDRGMAALTECRVLFRDLDQNQTLLEVQIFTGRPHQIRIHLAAAGYPIPGDPVYAVGGRPYDSRNGKQPALPGDSGYLLHSHILEFNHPETGQPGKFEAEPPSALKTPAENRPNKSL